MTIRLFAAPLIAAAAIATAAPAAADMMAACQTEIGQYCGGVSKGRGRIAACLVGRLDKLSANCKPEVQATMKSPFIPGDMRAIFRPGFSAPVPASCAGTAKSRCSGIATQGGTFACLYAYSNQAGGTCAADAKAAVAAAGQ